MDKKEIKGILSNKHDIWFIELTPGHLIELELEKFEGRLVKVTKEDNKLIIEHIEEIDPVREWEKWVGRLCGVPA